ncbi:sulfotransferase family protein [Hyella patelloides]|nr:sulfotransferase [Hyella patelloides]
MARQNQSNNLLNVLKPLEGVIKGNLTVEQKNILRDAVNLRVFSPALSDNLILILGCQRSGTTLALLMLQAHPQIQGIDETEFPSPFPFPSSIALYSHQLQKKSICLKLPEHIFNVEYIARHFPKVKILWIVRNPYSTISSMSALKNTQGSWIKRCGATELRRFIPFFPEIKQLDFDSLDEISLGAMVWKYKNQALEIYQEKGLQVFNFRYEDLIDNSQNMMSDILKFLDLPWSDRVLEYYKFHQPNKTYPGNTKGDRAIDSSRKSSKPKLTESEQNTIRSIAEDLIIQYGY